VLAKVNLKLIFNPQTLIPVGSAVVGTCW